MKICSRKSVPKEKKELENFVMALIGHGVFDRVIDIFYDSNCGQCFITTSLAEKERYGGPWVGIELAAVSTLSVYSIDDDITKHGAPCRCSQCVPPEEIGTFTVYDGGKVGRNI